MSEISFAEWRNNNQRANYPWVDGALLTSRDGFKLDRDLFDDARLYPIGGTAGVYLSRIVVDHDDVTIFIGDDNTAELAFVSYTALASPDDLNLVDEYNRPAGILVSSTDRLAVLPGLAGQGTHVFDKTATPFVSSVVVPLPQPGVRGLLLDDGTLLAGDIYLIGTDGIVLSMESGAIRVDIVGDPYALLKACKEEGVPLVPFCGVKTINKIHPDANGDFKLFGGANVALDNVLRVEMANGGLKVKTVGAIGNRNG